MGYQTNYNGHTYFVNVLPPVGAGDLTSQIYFSQNDNQCTEGDLAVTITPHIGDYDEMTNMQLMCKAFSYTNAAKTVTGCFSLASAVICAALAVPTEGASLLFCELAWNYADTTGAADCIQGGIGYVSDQLGANQYWKSLAIAMAINDANFADIFTGLMDVYCDPTINPFLKPNQDQLTKRKSALKKKHSNEKRKKKHTNEKKK